MFQLEKAVGYEIRRRIRAQIRIVKRLISEGKLSTVATTTKLKSVNKDSPKTMRTQSPEKTQTEYQVKFTSKATPESKKVDNKIFSHTDIISKKDTSERVTEYQSSYTYDERRSSEEISRRSRSRTPEEKSVPQKTTSERKPSKPELKKTPPISKTITEEKPEWVTQRNLRKVATTKSAPSTRVTTTTTTTKRTQEATRQSSPTKETKNTDVITSSYGVGPLDENGTPLFGLKALRAQNATSKGL